MLDNYDTDSHLKCTEPTAGGCNGGSRDHEEQRSQTQTQTADRPNGRGEESVASASQPTDTGINVNNTATLYQLIMNPKTLIFQLLGREDKMFSDRCYILYKCLILKSKSCLQTFVRCPSLSFVMV